MVPIDYFTVVIAALIAYIFQVLFYSPLFFGKKWQALHGLPPLKGKWYQFLFSFLLLCVMFFFLAIIEWYLGVSSFWDGVIAGVVVWLGFILPLEFFSSLWAKKPLMLVVIDGAAWLFVFCIGGGILAG